MYDVCYEFYDYIMKGLCMVDPVSNSVIALGDLSKPVNTLIEKISDALGGAFKPFQIKRVAKAEAEVAMIQANTGLEIMGLQARAMQRFIEEETCKQKNIEDIVIKAAPYVLEDAKPEDMDKDWISNFFDKSRIVSDDEMQMLWAKILAGEANHPGAFSKRTINFLSGLDKKEAEMFCLLRNFCVDLDRRCPVILYEELIYRESGLTFDVLNHLESIGLIIRNNDGFYRSADKNNEEIVVSYCGENFKVVLDIYDDSNLFVGNFLLSPLGVELASICECSKIDGFFELIQEKWSEHIVKS